MKKLLRMLGAIVLCGNTTLNIINCSCSSPNSNTQSIDLNTILLNSNLGEIYVGQADKPAADKIKSEIKKKNPSLDITNINILDSDITTTKVKVTGDGMKYTGELIISFTTINFKLVRTDLPLDTKKLIFSQNNFYIATYSSVYKSNGTDDFKPMNGTSDWITALATDKDGNIYAGNHQGVVYKSNGTDDFKPMNGKSGWITALVIDKDGNIYAGNHQGVVYKSNGTSPFVPMSGTSGNIYALTIDAKKNIYLLNSNGIYESNKYC